MTRAQIRFLMLLASLFVTLLVAAAFSQQTLTSERDSLLAQGTTNVAHGRATHRSANATEAIPSTPGSSRVEARATVRLRSST